MLRLFLLGTFELKIDDVPVRNLYSDKTRALLAYLALEADQPHTRGALATLLWPFSDERRAKQNLRQALSQLKKRLGNAEPPYLLITRRTVQWNGAADTWVDATAVQNGDVAHYRGALLPHLIIEESNLFEEWLTIRREGLHRKVMGMLGEKVEMAVAVGDYEQAINHARRQTELDPWDEAGYRAWMRCLQSAGRGEAATAVYERCKQALMAELGVAPEPETTAVWAEASETDAGTSPRLPQLTMRPVGLPREKTPFIGREEMLAEIEALLQKDACRLLTLLGLGGAGKTRLAAQVARRFVAPEKGFVDGVYFVSLVGSDSLVTAVARGLDFPFSGRGDLGAQLCDYLRNKRLLLLLDNCEELLAERPWIASILEEAQGVRLLATSRLPFELADEWLFPVDGLGVASQGENTAVSEAETLFVSAAQRAQARFKVTEEARPLIQQICRQVQGHPLSIELVASWVRLLDMPEIATEVGQNVALFSSESPQLAQRHRNLQSIFSYTWRGLSDAEQSMMGKLAVFRAGFTREAAQAVAGASLMSLLGLVNRALVQRQGTRFGLHEAVRQYAASYASALPHRQHAEFYITWLAGRTEALQRRLEARPLDEITAEVENVRAAWGWALANAPWLIEPAVAAWTRYIEQKGLVPREIDVYVAFCRALSHPAARAVRVRTPLLNIVAHWLLEANREEESHPFVAEALRLSKGHGLVAEQALATTNEALRLFWKQDFEGCLAMYEASLRLAEQYGDEAILAICQSRYGRTLENIGHFEEAIRWLNAAVQLAEKLGRVDISMELYQRLTYAYLNAGDNENMFRCARLYGRAAEKTGAEQNIAAANYLLGLAHDVTDALDAAINYYRRALAFFDRYGLGRRRIVTAVHLGMAYQRAGGYAEAEETLLWIRPFVDGEEGQTGKASIRTQLATLYAEQGHMMQAYAALREAIAFVDWVTPTSQLMMFFMHMAQVLLADGRVEEARPFVAYARYSPLTRSRHREVLRGMAVAVDEALAAEWGLPRLREWAGDCFGITGAKRGEVNSGMGCLD